MTTDVRDGASLQLTRNKGYINPCAKAGITGAEGHVIAVDGVMIDRLAETEVGDTDDNKHTETRDGDEVDEPVEDSVGVAAHTHESQQATATSSHGGDVRSATFGSLHEDPWKPSLFSEGVD